MRPPIPPHVTSPRRGPAALVASLLIATSAIVTAPVAAAAPMPHIVATAETGTGEVDIMAYVYDVRFVGWAASVYGEITAVDPDGEVPTGTVRVISHEPGNHTEEEPLLFASGAFYSDVYPTEVGTRQFTVEYSGDENFAPASETFEYDVPYGPDTATTLSANPTGPITVGETITFTARVTDSQGRPLDPSEADIGFYVDGERIFGEEYPEPWVATLTTSLPVGTHTVTAETLAFFYDPSTSNEVVVEVLPVERQRVKGTLSVSPQGIVPSGTTVDAVAEFLPKSGSGVVDGWVQFYDARTKVGALVELIDGEAHFSYDSLGSGPHLLIARYLGTDAFSPALTLPRFVYVRR
jgi:Bacterial Ig-like domain (group 3)